jgi:integrase
MAHHAGLYRRRQYWYFKYKDENGKWIEHATRTIDRKKALSIKSGFLRELETGQLPNDRSQWTLRKAAEAWLLDRKLRVARNSYFSEKTIVGSLKRHLGTETKLAKLANIHSINQYQTARLREGLSPKTVNNEVLVLGSILREASLWHRVSEQYKPLRFRKSYIGQALDSDERTRLLQVAGLASPTAVAPYAAVLAFATGMRSREIKQLQIGSIHLDENKPFLYVRRCTTKTNAGARYVALDTMACWALAACWLGVNCSERQKRRIICSRRYWIATRNQEIRCGDNLVTIPFTLNHLGRQNGAPCGRPQRFSIGDSMTCDTPSNPR